MGQTVLPIFYNVDPSDVEDQSGVFAVAFAEHETSCKDNMCLVQSWRDALTKVASISGWDSRDWDESTLIEEIVRDISDRLFFTSNTDAEDLVGIDSSIEEMNSLLCLGSNDVRMIGLWGMGGVGKTTIARVVYNRLSSRFEAKCFLANVKERFKKDGAVSVTERFLSTIFMEKTPSHCLLQADPNMARERLCHKRSIIVLDDVDKMEQLEILSNRCDWFGLGSRIIITTRDRHLLVAHEVEHIYEVKSLENDHSLMLFNQFAFRKRPVPEEYSELSKHVVHYAKGLPLALKVLGSFLCHRSKQDWESALKKLENIPNPEVQNVLRISYDSLDDEQKDIFLDIACFFNGMRKDQVTEFLDGCGFCTNIGISVLIDKSLLTIPSNMLEMYDLLQEMGWEIVRQESVKDPGKRSRLWIPTDVYRVLTNNMGSEKVEGILLDFSKSRSMQLGATTFAAMCNLRFLKFYDSTSPEAADTCKVNLPEGLQSLSDCLRHLHWHRYPLKSLPSRFSPENLVVLNLPHSSIEQLWHGNQDLINLKQIDLSHCTNLVGNVDLSMAPNLEQIMMNGCTSLHEAYMPHLNKLKFLTFSNCKRLLSVPSTINAKSLKTMSLFGCSSLTKFPEVSQNIEYFDMSETALEELPSSVQYLTELDRLNLERCKRLQHLPTTICKLKSLGFLDLSGCERLRNFPEILEIMDHLHTLKLEGTGIKELHPSIENLSGLKWLYLNHCQNFELLPSSIWSLQSLMDLFLSDCPKLERVPPSKKLRNFPSLHLEENSLLSTLRMPHQFFSISSLDLQGSNIESIPVNVKELPQLYNLNLRSCQRLASLPELPLSLIEMVSQDCISLRTVSTSWCSVAPEKWITKANYYYTNCFNLSENAQFNIVGNVLP